MKKTAYLSGVVSLLLAGNLAALPEGVTDIEAVNTALENNFNSGEITALTNMYSSNAVMLPPSSEILSTPDSIKSYWNGLRSIGVNRYSLYLVDYKVDGDVAYATSLWEASRKTSKDEVITMEGNISSVLEKQDDGSWKIRLQSWN